MIALVALFVALGGTGYAAVGDGGGAIKKQVISPGPGVKRNCGPAKVDGYATVTGGPKMPSTFTSSANYLRAAYNCAAGTVRVRRLSKGLYVIDFSNDPGKLGFGNVITCPIAQPGILCPLEEGDTVSVTRMSTGVDKGELEVYIQDSATGAPVDASLQVMIV